MSTYRLDKLLRPQSVAVIGASPRATSPGHAVLRNLSAAGFPGPIELVNPHYDAIAGIPAVKSFDALPHVPDLVVIAAPPSAVPSLVSTAGQAGSSSAVIITAGLGHGRGSLAEACARAARAAGLRLVGPNCLGVLAPYAKLNASFAASMVRSGDLALISQSGAIAAGLIEWASVRAIGFSAVVSLGDQIDVDLGDLLDFFALDRHPRHPALHRIGKRRAQVHVGGARGGTNQTGRGGQVGPARAGRQSGADPHGGTRRIGFGL
jgi:acetyltransferase